MRFKFENFVKKIDVKSSLIFFKSKYLHYDIWGNMKYAPKMMENARRLNSRKNARKTLSSTLKYLKN